MDVTMSALPVYFMNMTAPPAVQAAPETPEARLVTAAPQVPQAPAQLGDQIGPAYILDISPEGRAAYEASLAAGPLGRQAENEPALMAPKDGKVNTSGVAAMKGTTECQTCKNRKYVDVSNDSSVSFQSPTNVRPEAAAAAVSAHEGEHVRNEQAKAQQEGRKVVSQSVMIHTSVCPECGRVYVSGGETKTVTASGEKQNPAEPVQNEKTENG